MTRKTNGFTLIELLITVAIIGILAAISVPLYIGQQKKAAFSEAQTNLQNLRMLEEQFFADRGRYSPVLDATVVPPVVFAGTATYDITNDQVWLNANPNACDPPLDAVKSAKIICLFKFRPGNARDLKYNYEITFPDPNAPAGTNSSFVAFARPKAGTSVAGSSPFWINDRNQSNIQ